MSKGLTTSGAVSFNLGWRAEEDEKRCPSSAVKQEKGVEFLLPLSFLLFRASIDWVLPTHTGEGNLLSPPVQMLMSSRNILTQK